MEFHDAANIFPLDEENIGALAKDIRQNGQQIAIEILGGKIIDGRRRWLACEKAGVAPKLREVKVDDPVAYVLSLNLHRRHLTPGQLSMVGARARKFYDEQAKERQRAAGGDYRKKIAKEGRLFVCSACREEFDAEVWHCAVCAHHWPMDRDECRNCHKSSRRKATGKSVVANLPQPNIGKARDAVGKVVGVSGKSIDHATRVLEKAEPEVVKAVDEGRMAVSTAALLATEPPEVQRAEANNPKRRRNYKSVSKSIEETNGTAAEVEEPAAKPIRSRGKGVQIAHEAINLLTQIPKNDGLRKEGLHIVLRWVQRTLRNL